MWRQKLERQQSAERRRKLEESKEKEARQRAQELQRAQRQREEALQRQHSAEKRARAEKQARQRAENKARQQAQAEAVRQRAKANRERLEEAKKAEAAAAAAAAAQRRCIICLDDHMTVGDGIECAAGQHFCCDACFEGHVRHKAGEDIRLAAAREGRVLCPGNGCGAAPFSEKAVAQHVSEEVYGLHLKQTHRIAEAHIIQKMEEHHKRQLTDLERRLEAAEGEEAKVKELRKHVVEHILTLHCPHCNAAFLDFDNCFALKCHRCQSGFCAYCLAHCGSWEDTHRHVANCPHNLAGGNVFGTPEQFERAQRRRRERMLREYLDSLPNARTHARLVKACERDLVDVGLAPGDFRKRKV